MIRNALLPAVAMSLMAVSSLVAQTDSNAKGESITGEPQEVALINERVLFVKNFYPVDDAQVDQLRKDLESRINANQEYMKRNELLLRRRTTAISAVLPQDKSLTAERIKQLQAKYQEQIYRIREGAPLSLTNAVRMTEDMLDADARKTGRQKIAEFFAKQLDGRPLDPAHLDRLILSPVPMLNISQSDAISDTQEKLMGNSRATYTTAEKLAAERPSAAELKAREAAIKSKLEAQRKAAANRKTPAPVPPAASDRKPEEIQLEAPPLEKWADAYQTWSTNYDFSQEQKAAAEEIYNSCKGQAESKMKSVQEELAKANAMPEGPERDKAIRAARKPLDSVFTQMKLRVDAVASIEQRERYKSHQKAEDKSADNSKEENKS